MFDLTGKSVLLTGATGGIGHGITRRLRAAGARLVLSGTREAVLHDLAAEPGGECHVVACKLDDGEAVDRLFADATDKLGTAPDILVANAGITRDGLLVRMKDTDWHDVLQVNLDSFFRLCRSAMRAMMKRRSGRLIGVGSVVGTAGSAGQSNYAASKAGMVGFCKALAQEVASRNITVNCVAPGFISSPMTDGLPAARREAIMTSIPCGRLGEGDDVAAAVHFLASDEAGYITGQTLHVNGGMLMI